MEGYVWTGFRRLLRSAALMLALLLGLTPEAWAAPTLQDWQRDAESIYLSPVTLDPGATGTLLLATGLLMWQDQNIYAAVHQHLSTPELESAMGVVTLLGDGTVNLLLIPGALALQGDYEAAYEASNAVVYAGLATQVIKVVVGMPRPETMDGKNNRWFSLDDGYQSFPSGHTAAAFATATVLARHYPEYKRYFYGAAVLVGLSRIYLEKHWPSDVAMGAAIGVYAGNHVGEKARLFQIEF